MTATRAVSAIDPRMTSRIRGALHTVLTALLCLLVGPLRVVANSGLDESFELVGRAQKSASESGHPLGAALAALSDSTGLFLRSATFADTTVIVVADRFGAFAAYDLVGSSVSRRRGVSAPEDACPRRLETVHTLRASPCPLLVLDFSVLGAGDPHEIHIVADDGRVSAARIVLRGTAPEVLDTSPPTVRVFRSAPNYSPLLQPRASADESVSFLDEYRIGCDIATLVRVSLRETPVLGLVAYFEAHPERLGLRSSAGGHAGVPTAVYESTGGGTFRIYAGNAVLRAEVLHGSAGTWDVRVTENSR